MPELPEVETIVRALQQGGRDQPAVTGRMIRQAQVQWEKSIANISGSEFEQQIKDRKIVNISRRGKFIVFRLNRGFLLVHLRMSGDLRMEPATDGNNKNAALQPHDRVALNFYGGNRLVFNDTRKFGRMWLVSDPGEVLGNLGLEPFDRCLEQDGLYDLLQRKNQQIKPLLLDQSFLAGIGNIYADEALHLARIHPLKKASSIQKAEAENLLKSLQSVLKKGIEHNGASIDRVYRGGGFQDHFMVYQRTNEPCYTCGTPIQRITVGQRGTHFCPICQKDDQDQNGGAKEQT